ncbi:MAG: 50S ribosomal protein L1 [Victivallales bacterium]|nr:50S ribosomal protein L1 [Victivallales bacterium]
MANNSKLYKSQLATFDRNAKYTPLQAFEAVIKMPHVKFNETVEVAFKLGVDTKKSDQTVRGAVPLPKGTGKAVTVAVVADGNSAAAAKEAGAEHVGFDDLIEKIKGGWLEFDVLIATPEAMKQVRQLGRILGPRGLMPNPKTGTVTDDCGAAVREAKAGRVEFRADRGGCVHVPVGKVDFAAVDLNENFEVVFRALMRAKPAAAKGVYMLSCTVSSTMSPGIKVDVRELVRAMQ